MPRKKEIKQFEPFTCNYPKEGKNNFLNVKDGGLIYYFITEKEKMYKSILKNIEIALHNGFDYADVIKISPRDILIMKKIDFDYFLNSAMEYFISVEDYSMCNKIKKTLSVVK